VLILGGGALDDPRMHVVNADAFTWLRDTGRRFDTVIVDFGTLMDPAVLGYCRHE
jgi:spermidine synthase